MNKRDGRKMRWKKYDLQAPQLHALNTSLKLAVDFNNVRARAIGDYASVRGVVKILASLYDFNLKGQ